MEAIDRIIQKVKANTQDLSQQSQTSHKILTQQTSYKCELCRDTGMIIKNNEGMQPTMTRCKCQEEEILKRQWSNAGINPEKSNQTFSNFEVWNKSAEIAKRTAMTYYKVFEEVRRSRRNSIMFCGQVGSGKTHLSIALALNFIKKGIKVVYMPYRDIITSIKQNMLDEEFYKKQISKYQNAEVLLIDDLYKGKINDSDINIMFEIINYRYLNLLPIIVSSEFTTDRMLNFDEAIGSRIYEMCKDYIVQIEGMKNNYRLKE